MKIRAKIRKMYASGFSSTGHSVSKHEIKKIIRNNCECDCCGTSIFEMYDFPVFRDNRFLCEICERDKYYAICPICQDYFEEAQKAEDFHLLISREAVEEYCMEIKPGFYKTLQWPFYHGCLVGGFEGVFSERLHLIKECDINSMLKRLNSGSADENLNGECCPECFAIYTGQKENKTQYCNKEYGTKYLALQKEVIKDGH